MHPTTTRPTTKHRRTLARGLAFATVLVVLFTNLGGSRLFDRDEALNATCGREMFERGDLVVPTFNGELRTAKPALIYWFMSASYAMFGVSEFAARFFSAVASLGSVLCVFVIGRTLFDERAGLLSALVLVTSLLFAAVGRASTPDPFLLFGVTLAMTGFVTGIARRNGRFGMHEPGDPDPRSYVPDLAGFALMFFAMGFAVLAKGPVGVILPVGITGLYLLWATDARRNRVHDVDATASRWRRVWSHTARFLAPTRLWICARALRPLTMLAVVAVIALPWYVLVGLRTDGAWLRTFLGHDNLGRFLGPKEGHGGPIVYYVPAILVGFAPWSLFLPAAAVHAWRCARARGNDADAFRLLFCWAALVIMLFSLAGTKLPNYVLPAYPALALLVGTRLARWTEALAPGALTPDDRGFRLALRGLEIVTLLLLVGLPVLTHFLLPGYAPLAFVTVLPLLALGFADHAWQAERPRRAVVALVAGSVASIVGLLAVAAPAVSGLQDGVLLGNAARSARTEDAPVAVLGYFSPNLVFYAGREIERLSTPADVAALVHDRPDALVVVPRDQWDTLAPLLPNDVRVLSEQTEFLEERQVLLLGRKTRIAADGRTRR